MKNLPSGRRLGENFALNYVPHEHANIKLASTLINLKAR